MSLLRNSIFKKVRPFFLPVIAILLIFNANINKNNSQKLIKGPSYSIYPSKKNNWSYVGQYCIDGRVISETKRDESQPKIFNDEYKSPFRFQNVIYIEKVKYHSYPCKGENYLEDNFGVGWLWIRISQEKSYLVKIEEVFTELIFKETLEEKLLKNKKNLYSDWNKAREKGLKLCSNRTGPYKVRDYWVPCIDQSQDKFSFVKLNRPIKKDGFSKGESIKSIFLIAN